MLLNWDTVMFWIRADEQKRRDNLRYAPEAQAAQDILDRYAKYLAEGDEEAQPS